MGTPSGSKIRRGNMAGNLMETWAAVGVGGAYYEDRSMLPADDLAKVCIRSGNFSS